ncbi:MAG: 1,4-alpha-glucan branching enzyme, partial [Pseudomonadales bacterium]|nr:1,4-alpha-glucan branching enzyme [Pseudomonadales bacterium]
PALHQRDCDAGGFMWLQEGSEQQSLFAYMRFGLSDTEPAVVVVNMTPNTYFDYDIGVPVQGYYREVLNTDSNLYGGSNKGNSGGQHAKADPCAGQSCKISVCLPPLATLILICEKN